MATSATTANRNNAYPSRRSNPPDPMAICRSLRPADAGAVGAGVARGTVAHMVAAGERNSHEWTPAKNEMMEAFDRAGITAAFMEPEEGGFIAGPKNLALGAGRV